MYGFHERMELLTSRWGPGHTVSALGLGRGFQQEERIGVGASDRFVMTRVHWELRKCKMSLCKFLL